jgi:hypothetical protein
MMINLARMPKFMGVTRKGTMVGNATKPYQVKAIISISQTYPRILFANVVVMLARL